LSPFCTPYEVDLMVRPGRVTAEVVIKKEMKSVVEKGIAHRLPKDGWFCGYLQGSPLGAVTAALTTDSDCDAITTH
jgi:hypothetical protein